MLYHLGYPSSLSSHLATMMVVKSHQIRARYEQSQRFSRVCCFILLNHQIRTSEWFSTIGFSEILRNSAENHGITGKSLEFHEFSGWSLGFDLQLTVDQRWSKPQGALARRAWRRRAADLTSSLKRDNYIADLYGMNIWSSWSKKSGSFCGIGSIDIYIIYVWTMLDLVLRSARGDPDVQVSGSPAFWYGLGVWIGLWVQGMDRGFTFWLVAIWVSSNYMEKNTKH